MAAAVGVLVISVAIGWHLVTRVAAGTLGPITATYSIAVSSFVLSRFALAACYRPPRWADLEPTVAIVIPAFNEGSAVVRTIDACVALDYPADRLEIVCIDDGSTDDTADHMDDAVGRHGSAATLIRRLGQMMELPPSRRLSTATWEGVDGGGCEAGAGAVTALADPGDTVVICRTAGYGPFASPAEVSAVVRLPSDLATGSIGFASQTHTIELAVTGQDVELRARTNKDGWEVLAVGRLDAFSSDVAVRLTVVDGVATATVGSVRLTSAVPTDDEAGHLRLDVVELGAVSAGEEVRFLQPILRLGAAVGD